MKWPGKDGITLSPEQKTFELPPEGTYTVRLTGTTVRHVSSGSWLVFKEEIDDGPHKGYTVEEEFWIGDKMDYTLSRLGNICENADFWPEVSPDEEIEPDAFALLWPTGLRWRSDLVHKLQIVAFVNVNSYKDYTKTSVTETEECPFKKYLIVNKKAHEEWVGAGGKTWDSLVPRAQASFLSGVDLMTAYSAAPEKEEEDVVEMVSDDELPF